MFTREEEARLQAGSQLLTLTWRGWTFARLSWEPAPWPWKTGALLGSLVYFGGQDARGEAEGGRVRIRGRRGGEKSRCCRAGSFPLGPHKTTSQTPKQRKPEDLMIFLRQVARAIWSSGITPAQHAGGLGFNPQCAHSPFLAVRGETRGGSGGSGGVGSGGGGGNGRSGESGGVGGRGAGRGTGGSGGSGGRVWRAWSG